MCKSCYNKYQKSPGFVKVGRGSRSETLTEYHHLKSYFTLEEIAGKLGIQVKSLKQAIYRERVRNERGK